MHPWVLSSYLLFTPLQKNLNFSDEIAHIPYFMCHFLVTCSIGYSAVHESILQACVTLYRVKLNLGEKKKKGKKKACPKLWQWKNILMYKRKRQKRFEFLTTISSQLEVSGVLLPICRNMSSLDTACLYIISCLQGGENMKNH